MAESSIDFDLYLITDRGGLPPGRSLTESVRLALEGGVRSVQLREKESSAAELYRLALELRELTGRYGARLLINDRIDLAQAVGADGVHLSASSLPVAAARRILGPEKLIGLSTHHPREISTAAENGADFVTFSPVYFTPSKAAYGEPQGIDRLLEACASSPLPVLALGGIEAGRIAEVIDAGAAGIALISAILGAADPASAARSLLCALKLVNESTAKRLNRPIFP